LLDSPPAQRHPEVEPLPWQRFPEPDLDPAWGCSVFDVSLRARSTLAALPPGHRWTLVRLDTPANVAAGTVPWGPFAALDEDPARLDSRFVVVAAGPDATIAELLSARAEGPLLLVGRDNHQHGWVRRLADEARAASDDVLVADMGWPEAERRYADIATFGASRFLGASLLHLLVPGSAPEAGEGPS
jgi:beta-N-acetylhexosaminidase